MTKAESLAAFNIRKKNREKWENKNLTQSSVSFHPVTSDSDSTYGIDYIPVINHATSVTSGVSGQTNNISSQRSNSTIPINIYSSSSTQQGSSQPAVVPSGLNQIYIPAPSYFTVMNPTPQCSSSFNIDHGNYSNVIPPPSSFITSNSSMPINPYLSQPGTDIPRIESTRTSWQTDPCHIIHSAVLFNARSIKNKLPEFHHLIYSSELELVFFTESWLNDEATNSMLDPEHRFHVFRRDRLGQSGGGVCALLSRSINCFKMINLIPMQIICVNLYVLMPNLVILDTGSLSYILLHIHASKLEPTYKATPSHYYTC